MRERRCIAGLSTRQSVELCNVPKSISMNQPLIIRVSRGILDNDPSQSSDMGGLALRSSSAKVTVCMGVTCRTAHCTGSVLPATWFIGANFEMRDRFSATTLLPDQAEPRSI